MAKIVLLGAGGQVGYELVRALDGLADVVAVDRGRFDLLNTGSLSRVVQEEMPDLVINAAADTAVDRAESHFEECFAANATAPSVLAEACAKSGARLVHFSTDYVFDGTKTTPYVEEDATAPVNAYGRAKLAGEQAVLASDPRHLVFRLSWVYSWRGRNFALTMLRLAREGKPIRVVEDQSGSPSYAPDLAATLAEIVRHFLNFPDETGGLYHLSAMGQTSWYGFAQALLDEALGGQAIGGQAPTVEPIPTMAFPTPAARPKYSVLNCDKADRRFGVRVPPWNEGLHRWAECLRAKEAI